MFLSLIVTLGMLLSPEHDFHTTFMNITYQDDEKVFEIDLTMDTEHFEYSINQWADTTIRLGEPSEISNADYLINKYIKQNISLKVNGKSIPMTLELKQVNFAETTLHFKTVKHKKKVKHVKMRNTFMINNFPNQKNLVKFNYKGVSNNMLFTDKVTEQEIEFN